jgi:hypothetical protein
MQDNIFARRRPDQNIIGRVYYFLALSHQSGATLTKHGKQKIVIQHWVHDYNDVQPDSGANYVFPASRQ